MGQAKSSLYSCSSLSHTLLPGYRLPSIQLIQYQPQSIKIDLSDITQHQHLILLFLEAITTKKTTLHRLFKKLNHICDKYRPTLQALNSQLIVCFASENDYLSQRPELLQYGFLVDKDKQLNYALHQNMPPTSAALINDHKSKLISGYILIIKKHSLIHDLFFLHSEYIDNQLKDTIDILRFLN